MRRSHSLTLFLLSVLLSTTLGDRAAWAAPGVRLWTTYVDGGSGLNDEAVAMVASPDGRGIFATGATQTVSGKPRSDYLTVGWDASTGEELWTRRFGRAGRQDRPTSVAVALDGHTVYVTGISTDRRGLRAWTTIAYATSTGARRWVVRTRLRGVQFETFGGQQPTAVLATASRVIVAGNTQPGDPPGSAFPAVAVAYSPMDGHEIWRFRYSPQRYPGASPGAIVWSATVNPTRARVYLGIQVDETPAGNSEGVLALNARTGERLWRSRYLSTALSTHPESIAVAPDGRDVYVAGVLGLVPRRLLAFRARHGAMNWDADLGAGGLGGITSIAAGPDGGQVFATGTQQVRENVVLRTWAVEAETGELRWRSRFMRRSGSGRSISSGEAATVDPDGSVVYIVGDSSLVQCVGMDCAWTPDIVTITYDAATGTRLWSRLFGDPAVGVSESSTGIAVDPTGSTLSVVGTAPSANGDLDFVLIGYSAI
jgi:outer membrane protein assembly factor BamB